MSSLAAARADNFYHPPDWDPRKQSRGEHAAGGGAKLSKEDKWKAHPLRERAKRLATEGVLIIRFEMPFNVRCNGCGNHIGKGVRYDAEKRKIGKYFSTSIYSFRMLCHCEDGTSRTCQRRNPHWIEIQTDPKNADYVITEGAARLAEPSADDAEALGVERALDPDEASKRSANPFYRLEATGGGAAARKPWLERLQEQRDDRWHDDYETNRSLRRAHRSQRQEAFVEAAVHQARGVRVPLLPEHPADVLAAQLAPLQAARRASDVRASERLHQLTNGSIFGSSTKASAVGAVPSSTSAVASTSGAAGASIGGGRGGRASAQWHTQEAQRLLRLQLRRERDMCIAVVPAVSRVARPQMAPPVALVCVAAAPVASDATKSVATEAIETEAVKSEADVVDGSPSLRAASRKRERNTNSDDGRCRLGVRIVAYSDSDDEAEGWDSS
eukprot:jgi/Chrpa1/12466/Chrysochromulina_OHIO_Genome00003441-RA